MNLSASSTKNTKNLLVKMVLEYKSAMTVPQLAEILECSKSGLYAQIEEKRLPALKIGTMIRLDPGTVAEWIESRMTVISRED